MPVAGHQTFTAHVPTLSAGNPAEKFGKLLEAHVGEDKQWLDLKPPVSRVQSMTASQ